MKVLCLNGLFNISGMEMTLCLHKLCGQIASSVSESDYSVFMSSFEEFEEITELLCSLSPSGLYIIMSFA